MNEAIMVSRVAKSQARGARERGSDCECYDRKESCEANSTECGKTYKFLHGRKFHVSYSSSHSRSSRRDSSF